MQMGIEEVTKALFICGANKDRSPTAEEIFADWPRVETDSAGLNNDAVTPLSGDQLDWADIVFVMEKTHRNRLSQKFGAHLKSKRVICLDIADHYLYRDPQLIRLLETRAGRFLK